MSKRNAIFLATCLLCITATSVTLAGLETPAAPDSPAAG